ncbi:hypothetical protein [Streptomyces sp. WAC06614]|uniref:hypothetical protein n=1 Tax=Streptomyces sp. WAC06614 TaxID=2487416 RepID=UPI000F792FAE|nr:hypothetical protein [Streptomyces sp. WAC06614]RSS78922.1 hypothetical protein EF918_19200 [Streptomyces sp. WAC06614]
MRAVRILTTVLLAGATALTLAGPAAADTPSASPGDGKGKDKAKTTADAAPTEAGTSFRTAAPFRPGQRATASASTGDYLYWVLPLDSGQRATVKASVTLPEAASRHGSATWQLDVYDGLRRRQPCTYGAQTVSAGQGAAAVELSCTLRTVRPGAETWSDDPLPGSYYVRLTVVGLPKEDLGQPVKAAVEADVKETGGAYGTDGALGAPLVSAAAQAREGSLREPEDGWSGGRWSDRWLWTAAGGVLAALAGVLGHSLTRGSGRPRS